MEETAGETTGFKYPKRFLLESFKEHTLNPACRVLLPWNLDKDDLLGNLDDQRTGFRPFREWLGRLLDNLRLQENPDHTFHSNPFKLKEIEAQSVDWFGRVDMETGKSDRLGFVKMQVKVENDDAEDPKDSKRIIKKMTLPGAVFLRGGSVGMLMILQPNDAEKNTEKDKHVILTIQPRVAAGSLAFAEIPAGMMDGDTMAGAAVKEIKEETGITVLPKDLIPLSQGLVSKSTNTPWKKGSSLKEQESLHDAMYPSPGACDEHIPLFLWQRRVPREQFNKLQGKATGQRNEGENITLKLIPLEDLCIEAGRDAKALSAHALYQYHLSHATEVIPLEIEEDDLKDLK